MKCSKKIITNVWLFNEKKYIPKYQQITGNNFCNMCEFFWLLHSQIGSKFFKVLAKLTKFQIESNKKIQILYSTTLVLIFIPKLKLFKIKTKASNPYSFGTTDICFYCAPISEHLLLLCTNSQLPTFMALNCCFFPTFPQNTAHPSMLIPKLCVFEPQKDKKNYTQGGTHKSSTRGLWHAWQRLEPTRVTRGPSNCLAGHGLGMP